jgi:hypothetical protein
MTLLIRHSVTPVYSYAPRGETPVNLPALDKVELK